MYLLVLILGIVAGYFLSKITSTISDSISVGKKGFKLSIIIVTALLFVISYLKYGSSLMFLKTTLFMSLLIIISFVDIKHRIIPDKLVLATILWGLVLVFIGDVSPLNAILGMFTGGTLLLLLAMVPNALGGGDVKMMFAVGIFLGVTKTVYAIIFAFMVAAIISTILLLLRLKSRKDHIPFGPFLAIGSLIAYLAV
ncbi:prepilin peptidase [Alkalicella caledoniensis]|uniref:Prepilin peptidase n=1 Tax=Alkalicella caledoniensis TaxID=2731377 RepID=A0A7G9W7E4_ALKCA|nr:A24 family peptidase [Alkalicella caledoniensis]QNO14606.1 prepilin peptidase [Alkalicella caledoniensis]